MSAQKFSEATIETAELANTSKVLILGGGCYGSLFSSRLKRARIRGLIDYKYQMVVDINPECEIVLNFDREGLVFTNSDWIEFMTIYFINFYNDNDWIVLPCNTPHFIFRLYYRMLSDAGNISIEIIPARTGPGFPFEKHADDTLYMSYAEWQCLPLCREPKVCPAMRQKKSWNLKKKFMEYLSHDAILSTARTYIFESNRHVNGIALIKAKRIMDGYHSMLNRISDTATLFGIATLSECHGAFSLFSAAYVPQIPEDYPQAI